MVTGSSPLICRATEPAVPPRSTHPPHSPQTCSTPCPRRPTSPSVTHWARPCCCSPYLDCVAPAPSTATPPGCLGTGTWRPCAPANTPQIGRASCRERGEEPGGAGTFGEKDEGGGYSGLS